MHAKQKKAKTEKRETSTSTRAWEAKNRHGNQIPTAPAGKEIIPPRIIPHFNRIFAFWRLQ
jgi:hypothetical protein